MEFLPLTPDTVELVAAVYAPWPQRVSYYFPIDLEALSHTLFSQPEVHPATFEMHQEASVIAVDAGKPVGWIQSGYISDIPSIPDGEVDGLIRCLMIADGRQDVGAALLNRAIEVLSRRPVRAWRAFEHFAGYTFATGIGQTPHRMTEVTDLLDRAGFERSAVNLVYATESLEPFPRGKDLSTVEIELRPRSWSEQHANVEWDYLDLSENGSQVGYSVVVPVKRLTSNENESTLFIKGIATDPAHRRRGIGHLIMSTLWDHYHPQGIRRLALNPDVDNHGAQRFYEAVGFVCPDRTSPYMANKVRPV